MKTRKLTYFLLFLLFCMLSFNSCKKKDTAENIAPFSKASWENTLSDIMTLENTSYEETVSVYGGYSYIFPKKYLEFEGSIQYMFDEKESLSGIAWFSIGDNQQEAKDIYQAIYQECNQKYGVQEETSTNQMYETAQWELPECSVILVSFSQNQEYAVQVSYISNSVHKK